MNWRWHTLKTLAPAAFVQAMTDPARVLALTAELLALRPDVFVSGTDREARAAAAATQSIPVVFGVGVDPVGSGS